MNTMFRTGESEITLSMLVAGSIKCKKYCKIEIPNRRGSHAGDWDSESFCEIVMWKEMQTYSGKINQYTAIIEVHTDTCV